MDPTTLTAEIRAAITSAEGRAISRNGAADGTHDPDGGYAIRADDL